MMGIIEVPSLNFPRQFVPSSQSDQTSYRRLICDPRSDCRGSFENIFTSSRHFTQQNESPAVGTMGDLFRVIDWPIDAQPTHTFASVERLPAETILTPLKSAMVKKPNNRTFAELIGRGFKDRLVGWKEKSKGTINQPISGNSAPRNSVTGSEVSTMRQSILTRASFCKEISVKPRYSNFRDLVAPVIISEESPDSATRDKVASKSPKRKFQIRVLDGLERPSHKRQKSLFVESRKKMSRSPEASQVKVADSQILSEAKRGTEVKKQGRFSVLKKKDDARSTKTGEPLSNSTNFSVANTQIQDQNNIKRVFINSNFMSPQDTPINTKRVSKETILPSKRNIAVLASGLEAIPQSQTTRLARVAHKQAGQTGARPSLVSSSIQQ